MAKRKHHFVPRFYLKAFESEPQRIHLYNLNSSLPVENAGLRGQCYRSRFYGPNDNLEDNLAKLESCIAPILRSTISKGTIPSFGSGGYLTLLAFVAMQSLRTPASAERVNQIIDKAIKQAHSNGISPSDADIESMRFGFDNPVLMSLRFLPDVLEAILDLRAHLIVSLSDTFITSDNPVFKYNQYCKDTRHEGITGARQRGLQIFVPLSPRHHLILYDGMTYSVKIADRIFGGLRSRQSDIDSLNKMQLISANENVYFSNWQQLKDINRLLPFVKHLRIPDPTVVQEYGQDDDPNASLLHIYEQTADMTLNLTFLSVKRRAAQVPIADRPNYYRGGPPGARLSGPGGRSITFSRFLGRR